MLLSQHNSLVGVVNAALGGEKKSSSSGPPGGYKDLAEGHTDVDSAVAAINKAFMI